MITNHAFRKTRQVKSCILFAAFYVLLTGCYVGGRWDLPATSPVPENWQKEARYFIPTAGMAPMIGQNEDFRADLAYYTGTDDADGYSVDLSGRIYKNWAAMGSYKAYTFNREYDDIYYSNFRRWEFGAGYLLPLRKNWNFEAFAGYGNQTTENQFHTGQAFFNNKYFFVQPAIFFQDEQGFFSAGVASRFSFQNHTFNQLTYDAAREIFTDQQVNILTGNNGIVAWEPSIQAAVGVKFVKLVAQYTYMTHFNAPDLHGKPGMFSIGIRSAISHDRTATTKPTN